MAYALNLASLPAAWIVPDELPCLMCWLAAEAAAKSIPPQSPPSGPLPLRALPPGRSPSARSSRASRLAARRSAVARFLPRAAALRGLAKTPDRFPKRTIHYETLYVVVLLDDSC